MVNPNVKWHKYLNSSNPAINKYLSNYGDELLLQTFQRLTLAIKSKKSQIILFRFKESDIVSKIYQKDYIIALEALLNLCVNSLISNFFSFTPYSPETMPILLFE